VRREFRDKLRKMKEEMEEEMDKRKVEMEG
jgi:hypothetical protein